VNSKGISGGSISIINEDSLSGLILLDGKIYNGKINDINPESIQSINVLKDEPAVIKYGDKGKNGVIEIVSKPAGKIYSTHEKIYYARR
jgi:outer membrane receptor for ferrienterochelin and colicin